MEAHFVMTPEAERFLSAYKEAAEYVVAGPVDIEVELKSGEVHHPQEIRERVVRCRDCEFYEGGGCTLLDFSATDMDLGFCKWAVPRDKE